MAVGLPLKTTYADGDVYSASDVNDTNGTINLTAAPYAAGKNKIINGAFNVWQRGTSFSNPASGAYTSDRWIVAFDGTGATRTVSAQTFTPGTAPVNGYEGTYFLRYAQTVAGSGNTSNSVAQRIEDVRTFAGQTVTLSFWAKADASRTVTTYYIQNFGSGGSGDVVSSIQAHSITTGWTRFTATIAIPSVAGKTIGTGSYLSIYYAIGASPATYSFDIWGVQLEAGSVATPFQTATGTIQGELAACQRYYFRFGGDTTYLYAGFGSGSAASTTQATIIVQHPVPLRTNATSADFGTIGLVDGVNGIVSVTSVTLAQLNQFQSTILANVASGLTQYRWYRLSTNNSASGYFGLSAEL